MSLIQGHCLHTPHPASPEGRSCWERAPAWGKTISQNVTFPLVGMSESERAIALTGWERMWAPNAIAVGGFEPMTAEKQTLKYFTACDILGCTPKESIK